MTLIRYLLSKIIILIPLILILGLLFWAASRIAMMFPQELSSESDTGTSTPKKSFFARYFSADILPDPQNMQTTITNPHTIPVAQKSVITYTLYGPGEVWNPGKETFSPSSTGFIQPDPFVRHLSVPRGGQLSTGAQIYGEAKDLLFNQKGEFQILLVTQARVVISVGTAKMSDQWATPGWNRFQASFTTPIRYQGPCTLVFRSPEKNIETTLPMVCK